MARRRREGPSNPTDQQPQESTSGEPQIEVKMRGSADDVKKQLGVATEAKPEPEKKNGNGHDDEKGKFVEALRGSKYIIRVKRMTPREFNGIRTNVEVWNAELPLGYQEIQDEVAKEFGGGKYRVAVVDPASNTTIAADTFVVDGEPIIPESDVSQEELDRVLMRGQPKSAADLTEEGLDRRARVSAKMLEVEALEAQLEEARKRRTGGAKESAQDNSRIDELDRKLAEAKHQAELEARDRKHAEEIRELKALIAQNAKPQKEESNGNMMMLLEQMREDRKAAQAQFTAILTQMKDDKLNAVLEEVKSIRNKPAQQSGSLLDQAEAMLKLKKLFGWGGDDDDEEDGDDPDDDRPWWERALDKLGDKLGGKFGDKLIAKFTDMEEKGETVDREKFIKGMNEYADQVATEALARKVQSQQQLPAPPPPAATLPPPSPSSTATAPVTTLPPPPPPGSTVTAPPPPAATLPQTLTLEQEITIRVGGVLEMLEREIELRPNEYNWNYEGAFLSLPEPILEKACAAPDPVTMLDAFALPHISPEKLAEMKAKISGNPRIMAWVKAGHDDLKIWHQEKLKDPKFDPFSDEDEDEGGEE